MKISMLLFFLSQAFFTLLLSCTSTKYLVSKTYPAVPSIQQENLLVFLPGRESDVNSFEESGLLNVARSSGIPADCVSLNATFPFYADMTLLTRMHEDVFGKAELTNYRNYWLIGNSMGAIGALLYVKKYPGKIKGIILMGPYLGEGAVITDIGKAGSLKKWDPKALPWMDYVTDIWAELKDCVADQSGKYPVLVFLAGKTDRYHKVQELLAKELPRDRVFWADGGHDWPPWIDTFSNFLKSDYAKKLFLSR